MIERVARTESTNTDLLGRIRAWPTGTPFEPVLLVAHEQTGGRGRHGRTWHAEPGASLTASLAWPLAGGDFSGLSLAVGVALAEALDGAPGAPRIGLKWPNDLMLLDDAHAGTGRKLGGVLIETLPLGDRRAAVIGIGINVMPVRPLDARHGVASLGEIDPAATVERVLKAVTEPLIAALREFDRAGFAAFADRYARRDALRGLPVAAGSGATAVSGRVAGISPLGELLIDGRHGASVVRSGEVVVLAESGC